MAKDKYKIVVGAGISGITIAQRLVEAGHKVLLIEKSSYIGGNCHDYYNADGILVPTHGPHFFHTDSEQVWQYINKFSEWIPYVHRVLAVIDGELKIVPPTKDYADKVFDGYTKKHWGEYANKLNPEVKARVRIREENDTDDRYFKDKYQVMPKEGYTKLFFRMLHGVKVMFNTDYFKTDLKCDYYTGRIDEFFGCQYGKLPFMSLKFEHETLNKKFHQLATVINYPQTERYLRITEPKHATRQEINKTTIIKEYPKKYGEPYYPIPVKEIDDIREKYLKLAEKSKVIFVGRLGRYEYINMDKAIELVLNMKI